MSVSGLLSSYSTQLTENKGRAVASADGSFPAPFQQLALFLIATASVHNTRVESARARASRTSFRGRAFIRPAPGKADLPRTTRWAGFYDAGVRKRCLSPLPRSSSRRSALAATVNQSPERGCSYLELPACPAGRESVARKGKSHTVSREELR